MEMTNHKIHQKECPLHDYDIHVDFEIGRSEDIPECSCDDASEGPFIIEHDGFVGNIIGRYVTREGKIGVVLQQVGTRVVHVYGEKWLKIYHPENK